MLFRLACEYLISARVIRPGPVTVVKRVGAGARVAPGVEIGQYALVGIGAVILRVAPHALVLGNPGRAVGWVCRCAATLDSRLRCPQCDRAYQLDVDQLTEVQPGQ